MAAQENGPKQQFELGKDIFFRPPSSTVLEEHDGKSIIGGRTITSLWFADDIDSLAKEEQELEALVETLDKTCTRYTMEISAGKTNSANDIKREHKVKGQRLEVCEALTFLIDNIHIRFGSKLYRQIVSIPMGTNCVLL